MDNMTGFICYKKYLKFLNQISCTYDNLRESFNKKQTFHA